MNAFSIFVWLIAEATQLGGLPGEVAGEIVGLAKEFDHLVAETMKMPTRKGGHDGSDRDSVPEVQM